MLFKENAGKKEFIFHVLERDNIRYSVTEDGSFILPDDIDLIELAEDVACEEQRQSTEAKIPVYSKRTLENKEKLARLKAFYGKNGFHVLEKDKDVCMPEIELLKVLSNAENDMKNGRIAPVQDTFNDLRQSLTEKHS